MKLNLGQYSEAGWVKILNFKFSGDADVWLRFLDDAKPKILKMKFDQDLCLNLQYDFGKMNSTLGSVVPLAMFYALMSCSIVSMAERSSKFIPLM